MYDFKKYRFTQNILVNYGLLLSIVYLTHCIIVIRCIRQRPMASISILSLPSPYITIGWIPIWQTSLLLLVTKEKFWWAFITSIYYILQVIINQHNRVNKFIFHINLWYLIHCKKVSHIRTLKIVTLLEHLKVFG